jgi:hypothetical protein
LAGVLKEKEVIMSCKVCLEHLHQVLSSNELWSGEQIQAASVVGSFMAAYMIEGHPEIIFESLGLQETDLVLSARQLLYEFDQITTWCSSLQEDAPISITLLQKVLAPYPEALARYLNLFRAWKARDQVRLRDLILRSLRTVVDSLCQPFATSSDPSPPEGGAAASSAILTERNLWSAATDVTLGRLQLLAQARIMRDRLRRIGCADVLADFDSKHPWLVTEIEAAEASDFAAHLVPTQ